MNLMQSKAAFPFVSEDSWQLLNQLPALYENWNAKINVVSRKDMDQLWERHILHSLCIGHVAHLVPGMRILDLGTGGGFPGIPLAIAYPDIHWVLNDSIGKKVRVVQEVKDALGLSNVEAIHARCESLEGPWDAVVTRAVAPARKLLQWVGPNMVKGSELYALKGGDLKEELAGLKSQTHAISQWLDAPFFDTKAVVVLKR